MNSGISFYRVRFVYQAAPCGWVAQASLSGEQRRSLIARSRALNQYTMWLTDSGYSYRAAGLDSNRSQAYLVDLLERSMWRSARQTARKKAATRLTWKIATASLGQYEWGTVLKPGLKLSGRSWLVKVPKGSWWSILRRSDRLALDSKGTVGCPLVQPRWLLPSRGFAKSSTRAWTVS